MAAKEDALKRLKEELKARERKQGLTDLATLKKLVSKLFDIERAAKILQLVDQ
jgi:hypothetical protein